MTLASNGSKLECFRKAYYNTSAFKFKTFICFRCAQILLFTINYVFSLTRFVKIHEGISYLK